MSDVNAREAIKQAAQARAEADAAQRAASLQLGRALIAGEAAGLSPKEMQSLGRVSKQGYYDLIERAREG